MAEPAASELAPEVLNDEAAFQAFHDHRWDLDKDFLGGLVLALGGYHALARTAPQADIIMHSRIFYYARIRGATIPHAPYRAWLRRRLLDAAAGPDHQQPPPRLWEWDLLTALCNHRDRLAAGSGSGSGAGSGLGTDADRAARDAAAAAEKDLWLRELLGAGVAAPNGAREDAAASAPAWMAAAPRGELYVTREAGDGDGDGDGNSGGGQVPYPEQFAAIIKAVQSGEQIEGIVEIPDVVARNPTTTPFGKMARPRKPWETAQDVPDSTPDGVGSGLESSIDQSFPEQEDAVHQTS